MRAERANANGQELEFSASLSYPPRYHPPVETVTREHLYSEVWAEPMTTVAKRYDVSLNYLARRRDRCVRGRSRRCR